MCSNVIITVATERFTFYAWITGADPAPHVQSQDVSTTVAELLRCGIWGFKHSEWCLGFTILSRGIT